MPRFFITGTDTGVGKTWFTCWLVRAWRAQGLDAAGLKPIATGDREDARLLEMANDHRLSLDEINPVHFREPAAPLFAARAENRSIPFAALKMNILALSFSHLAVEGVGGWRVPLAPDYDVRDWARDLDLPVVIVARGTLGTLNHTLLTVESIRAAELPCAGIVVNAGLAEPSPDFDLTRSRNAACLRDITGLPVLELHRDAQAPREIPFWLGGKEI